MIARKPFIALFFYVCLFGTIGNALNIKASAQQYGTPADCLEMESIFRKCLGRDKKVYKDRISYCIQKPGEPGCDYINSKYVDPDKLIKLRMIDGSGGFTGAIESTARLNASALCDNLRKGLMSIDFYTNSFETRIQMIDRIIHPDDREKANAVEWTVTGLVMDLDCRE